jgi:hypothetical protein
MEFTKKIKAEDVAVPAFLSTLPMVAAPHPSAAAYRKVYGKSS